jgi:uncharacterized protein (TIGR02757 family)
MKMDMHALEDFLNRKMDEYYQPSFIANDPICVPHQFKRKQDIEIAGFFAAIFSWGNRKTIIQKAKELMQRMDGSPYQFIRDHRPGDLKVFLGFKHRTFNTTDLLYFISFLKFHYDRHGSLESAFLQYGSGVQPPAGSYSRRIPRAAASGVEAGLSGFYHYFFSLDDSPLRTHKHIASPEKKSTCKRLNMFLRWMVRKDEKNIDFGIWKQISPSQLICPVDLHVARVARRFGMVTRKQTDWQTAVDLTGQLRRFDEKDPVKYDFALFGLGALEHF